MPFTIAILALSTAAFTGPGMPVEIRQKSKPVCGAASVGKMWPDDANRDTKALRIAAQNGELELCGKHRDGYRWQFLGVNVRQLQAQQDSAGLGEIDQTDRPDVNPPDASPRANDISGNRPKHDATNDPNRLRHRFQTIRRVFGL